MFDVKFLQKSAKNHVKIIKKSPLRASWALLRASWGRLGGVLERLGRILERLGGSWRRLGASWARLGASWAVKATFYAERGGDATGAPWGGGGLPTP